MERVRNELVLVHTALALEAQTRETGGLGLPGCDLAALRRAERSLWGVARAGRSRGAGWKRRRLMTQAQPLALKAMLDVLRPAHRSSRS